MKHWSPRLARFAVALVLGGWVVWVALMDAPDRGESSTFGQFALAAATMVLLLWDLLVKVFKRTDAPDTDLLADGLARAMRVQWEHAAADRRLLLPAPLPIRWERCAEPVAGPVAAAVVPRGGQAQFDPLPGLAPVTAAKLRSGDRKALHRIYGGLASGRLMLVGGPGSGKSSAAVLLLLDALRHRDGLDPTERQRVPVPVMFTMSGWDPDTTPLEQWLITTLRQMPSFHLTEPQAAALLQARKIAVFLDGLDEVPAGLRGVILRALSEQSSFRLVLLTRTRELVDAAAGQTLAGAVALELSPLRPADVADYLARTLTDPPPAPWQAVIHAVTNTPDTAFARALSSPLTVSLLRDIYGNAGPVDELLDITRFPDAKAVENHLLDQVVATAYERRPGERPYRCTAAAARSTLEFVARRLSEGGTRDLTLWDITRWVSLTGRLVLTGIVLALVSTGGFVVSLGEDEAGYGLVFGVIALLAAWMKHLFGPMTSQRFELRRLFTHQAALCGVAAGLIAGGGVLPFLLARGYGLVVSSLFGAVSFGMCAVLAWLGFGLRGKAAPRDHPVAPWVAVKEDLTVALVLAFVSGVGMASARQLGHAFAYSRGNPAALLDGFADDFWPAVLSGVIIGVVLAAGFSHGFQLMIAQIWLAVRYRTPLRFTRFLEDAHERHLLRVVGPIYQFRHATLQDRLAGATTRQKVSP